MKTISKTTRGGKRKGAGRKLSGNVTFSARVKPEHVAKLKAFIEKNLRS